LATDKEIKANNAKIEEAEAKLAEAVEATREVEKSIQQSSRKVQEYQIDLALDEARTQAENVSKRYQDVEAKLREQKAAVEALKADANADADALAVAVALQTRLEARQAEVRKEAEVVSYNMSRAQQQADQAKGDLDL
jgi:chromosome segregation ATPase